MTRDRSIGSDLGRGLRRPAPAVYVPVPRVPHSVVVPGAGPFQGARAGAACATTLRAIGRSLIAHRSLGVARDEAFGFDASKFLPTGGHGGGLPPRPAQA